MSNNVEHTKLKKAADLHSAKKQNSEKGNEIVHTRYIVLDGITYKFVQFKDGSERIYETKNRLYSLPKRIQVPKEITKNKLIQPVLYIAEKKLNKIKNQAKRKNDIQKLKQLNNYNRDLLNKSISLVPIRIDRLLKWLAVRKLKVNPEIGAKLIIEAYQEYYKLGSICKICKRRFTQKNKGRKSEYCSKACKQKAYRRRK